MANWGVPGRPRPIGCHFHFFGGGGIYLRLYIPFFVLMFGWPASLWFFLALFVTPPGAKIMAKGT